MRHFTIWVRHENGRGGSVDVGASTQEAALRIVADRYPEWKAEHIAETDGVQGSVTWEAPLWMQYAAQGSR